MLARQVSGECNEASGDSAAGERGSGSLCRSSLRNAFFVPQTRKLPEAPPSIFSPKDLQGRVMSMRQARASGVRWLVSDTWFLGGPVPCGHATGGGAGPPLWD